MSPVQQGWVGLTLNLCRGDASESRLLTMHARRHVRGGAESDGMHTPWPPPSFRNNEGELLTRVAIGYRAPRGSNVQLRIVLYLVSEGAALDREGFR